PGSGDSHSRHDDSVDRYSKRRERHRPQWSGGDVGDEQRGRRDGLGERSGDGRGDRFGHDHRDERGTERDIRHNGHQRAGGFGNGQPGDGSLTVGATTQLTATPKDANGTALSGRVVTWATSNAAAATVAASGFG